MAMMRKGHLFGIIFLAIAIALAIIILSWPGNSDNFSASKVAIVTKSGDAYAFSVEVAETDEQKATGLMFRKELPEKSGMLFINENEAVTDMWMKNTFIPIDILFINADGVIVKIHRNAVPESTSIISSDIPVKGVLEIGGGLADKFGINYGDLVLCQAFGTNRVNENARKVGESK